MARGSAAADFDNDGDLDIAINTIGGRAVILRNESPPGNWLMVDPGAIVPGLWVEVGLDDGTTLYREVNSGSSYLASEDPRLHFGLGSHDQAEHVNIRYPDGRRQDYNEVVANQILHPN
jgi:hypothetical protein